MTLVFLLDSVVFRLELNGWRLWGKAELPFALGTGAGRRVVHKPNISTRIIQELFYFSKLNSFPGTEET